MLLRATAPAIIAHPVLAARGARRLQLGESKAQLTTVGQEGTNAAFTHSPARVAAAPRHCPRRSAVAAPDPDRFAVPPPAGPDRFVPGVAAGADCVRRAPGARGA